MYHVYLFETMKRVLLTVKYSILSPQIILWSSIDAGIPEQLLLKKKKKRKKITKALYDRKPFINGQLQ